MLRRELVAQAKQDECNLKCEDMRALHFFHNLKNILTNRTKLKEKRKII